MNKENFLSNIKYGLVAITGNNHDTSSLSVVHFCGYPSPPTETDKKLLETELNSDAEFGLVGRINNDVFIIDATEDMIKFFTTPNENHQVRND